MKKKYDLIVVIGRFQPIHIGHEYNVQKAKELADRVLVLVGSASTARSPKNPWTYEERKKMIQMSFPLINIRPLDDYVYDENFWLSKVQAKVAELEPEGKVGILGHYKDSSSYYLHSFPDWDFIETGEWAKDTYINATDIRKHYFEYKPLYLRGVLSDRVWQYLDTFKDTEEYKRLQAEYVFYLTYDAREYPVIISTVDAVVVQSGHILLIKRKSAPGKDLWALPGGHINPSEKLANAAVRELREETKVKIPEGLLLSKAQDQDPKVFDDPNRSQRGRVITNVFYFELDSSKPLPDIRGNDDAKEAKWFPISEFLEMESEMYEDHWSIAYNMVK